MTGIHSLGVHVPSGVSHLVEEKVLPEDPPASAYSWHIFQDPNDGATFDELVVASPYVVWSRGDRVHRVYSFAVEKEPVKQALFAAFSQQERDTDTVRESSSGKITVRKRKIKTPKTPDEHPENVATPAGQDSSGASPHAGPGRERALVVVLASHMQIFFLTGARSLVPLKFEVDKVFALPEGLIIQRKTWQAPQLQQSILPPKTPLNSFALSQSFAKSPETTRLPPNAVDSQQESPFIKALFKSAIADHESRAQGDLPSHYHLPDPFSELGGLGQSRSISSHTHNHSSRQDEILSRAERLIYLSSQNEAPHCPVPVPEVLLAVSINAEKRQLNVWQASKPRALTYWKPRRRLASYDAERKRRRRSSQPGTGAATPNPRHSIGPRESHIGLQDSFSARDDPKDDGDLAAKLDPAFQKPGAPGPTTRRISSMLARSDLTGSDIFNETATGAGAAASFRRGHSLGAAGPSNRSFRQPSDRHADLRSSMRSEHAPLESDHSDSDENEGVETKKYFWSLMSSTKGLRLDYRLDLLQSIDVDDAIADDIEVFTCGLTANGKDQQFLLCVVNRRGGELLQFHLSTTLKDLDAGERYLKAKVMSVSRLENITDACVLMEEDEKRLVILSKTKEGTNEVYSKGLDSTVFRQRVPTRLLQNFPFSIGTDSPLHSRRTTGPKRLIDDLALPLTAIVRCAANKQVVVKDFRGTAHRLYYSTRPESSLVARCLEICREVARIPQHEDNALVYGWWEAQRYLSKHGEGHGDLEWKAFIVLIVSLCCPSKAKQPQTSVRSTRRKGGLLRSGSGASTDLSDFYYAIAQEANPVAGIPSWMDSANWAWALSEQIPADQTPQSHGLGLSPPNNKHKNTDDEHVSRKSTFLIDLIAIARDFSTAPAGKAVLENLNRLSSIPDPQTKAPRHLSLAGRFLIGLHFFREELRLNLMNEPFVRQMTPLLAQIGGWLGWSGWSWKQSSVYMIEDADMGQWCFEETPSSSAQSWDEPDPPSILRTVAQSNETGNIGPFFEAITTALAHDRQAMDRFYTTTPRLRKAIEMLKSSTKSSVNTLHLLQKEGINQAYVESLPEGVAAPSRSIISLSQAEPPRDANHELLKLLDREDLAILFDAKYQVQPSARSTQAIPSHRSFRDYHAICRSAGDDEPGSISKTDASAEIDRSAVTRMMFKEDQRVREANKLLHPLEPPVIRCIKEPEWSEQDFLEAEQELAKVVAVRTLSVCAGRGLLLYGGRSPLLTERFPTHGFTLSCVMKPSNNSVTADKEVFTEEKVSWAFFHAGAEAGLSISKNSKGIDTSWIVFNKPPELNNRHAGFLLALGLNGHLKNIAKWVAFKYLTPKHTMTSVGLLLGLAASYLGTMDTLIVRLLSVHVTRMLPPGAAELNLSPLTQTTGILALGLLYCNTQHRRMSEIMLSEMENIEQEDNDNPLENLRDEGYRLAAGFALGYINLGQGKDLRGLRDMHLVERLLALSVSTKRVDLVHVLDKASAAAAVAIALIFMKSEDEALARKVDIPDTIPQFEYVRPDLFLLRTVARHLIMWSKIRPSEKWLLKQLPPVFRKAAKLDAVTVLDIKDLPLYNTIAGLCFVIGLRFAGTADHAARDVLIRYLDQFIRLARLPAITYDHRLTRTTVRNCQDATALAAACVMAGTGDVVVLRRLRSLHGRIDQDTPYGSHMAAHQAIGALFLAGGTHTFNTSNLAIASLLCAFYPLFPTSVLDNKGHLQAFRHLWALAAEPRCLVVRNVDSHRPISVPVSIKLTNGAEQVRTAPCLLPSLEQIARIELADPRYRHVRLDLASNAQHRAAFARHQSIFARRKAAAAPQAGATAFGTSAAALADEDAALATISLTSGTSGALVAAPSAAAQQQDVDVGTPRSLEWVFELPAFAAFSAADRALALPPAAAADVPVLLANRTGTNSSPLDDRLMLSLAVDARRADRLWSLRILFAWADRMLRREVEMERSREKDEQGHVVDSKGEEKEEELVRMGWLEREVVGSLRAELAVRMADGEEEERGSGG